MLFFCVMEISERSVPKAFRSSSATSRVICCGTACTGRRRRTCCISPSSASATLRRETPRIKWSAFFFLNLQTSQRRRSLSCVSTFDTVCLRWYCSRVTCRLCCSNCAGCRFSTFPRSSCRLCCFRRCWRAATETLRIAQSSRRRWVIKWVAVSPRRDPSRSHNRHFGVSFYRRCWTISSIPKTGGTFTWCKSYWPPPTVVASDDIVSDEAPTRNSPKTVAKRIWIVSSSRTCPDRCTPP